MGGGQPNLGNACILGLAGPATPPLFKREKSKGNCEPSRSRAEHGFDRRVASERPFAATALSSCPGRLFAKPNRGRTILSQEFEAQRIVNGKRHVTPDAHWTKWGSARTALNRDNCGLMRAQEHARNYIFIKKIIVLKKKLCRLFLWH